MFYYHAQNCRSCHLSLQQSEKTVRKIKFVELTLKLLLMCKASMSLTGHTRRNKGCTRLYKGHFHNKMCSPCTQRFVGMIDFRFGPTLDSNLVVLLIWTRVFRALLGIFRSLPRALRMKRRFRRKIENVLGYTPAQKLSSIAREPSPRRHVSYSIRWPLALFYLRHFGPSGTVCPKNRWENKYNKDEYPQHQKTSNTNMKRKMITRYTKFWSVKWKHFGTHCKFEWTRCASAQRSMKERVWLYTVVSLFSPTE